MKLSQMAKDIYRLPESHKAKLLDIYLEALNKMWDPKLYLDSMVDIFKIKEIPTHEKLALQKILTVILWGELAAWKVSASLADQITELEPKLAATSQIMDEARHFIAIQKYFELLDLPPEDPNNITTYGIGKVIEAPNLLHKLIGMQLMVEPVAMSIFQALQNSSVDPVLSSLLQFIMRDEKRHIRFGVNYLPIVLKNTSKINLLSAFFWQTRILLLEVDGLKELEPSFIALGIKPEEVFRLAKTKQSQVLEEILQETKLPLWISKEMQKLFQIKMDVTFSGASLLSSFRKQYMTRS